MTQIFTTVDYTDAHLPLGDERPASRARSSRCVVVWLFLRDWRATAVTALAMPASLIPTFAFMHLVESSLNVG